MWSSYDTSLWRPKWESATSSSEKGTGCGGSSILRNNKNQMQTLGTTQTHDLVPPPVTHSTEPEPRESPRTPPSCPVVSSIGFLSARDVVSKRAGLEGF